MFLQRLVSVCVCVLFLTLDVYLLHLIDFCDGLPKLFCKFPELFSTRGAETHELLLLWGKRAQHGDAMCVVWGEPMFDSIIKHSTLEEVFKTSCCCTFYLILFEVNRKCFCWQRWPLVWTLILKTFLSWINNRLCLNNTWYKQKNLHFSMMHNILW